LASLVAVRRQRLRSDGESRAVQVSI